jgi:hypothetical protein
MRKSKAVLRARLVLDSAKRWQKKANRKAGPATESLWTNQLIAGLTGIVAAVLSLMVARRKGCSPRREAPSGLKASA